MFGQEIGEFNVYVRFYSNGPLQKLYGVSGTLKNKTKQNKELNLYFLIQLGERGNAWIRHEINLDYTTPFQVLIEGVIGDGYRSDIALDDTVFTPECQDYSNFELPETTIITTTTPTPCPAANQTHCAGSDICIESNQVENLNLIQLMNNKISFFFLNKGL